MNTPVRCLAWGTALQQSLVKDANAVDGIDVVLAGSPTSEDSRHFAQAAEAERCLLYTSEAADV